MEFEGLLRNGAWLCLEAGILEIHLDLAALFSPCFACHTHTLAHIKFKIDMIGKWEFR